MEQFDKDLLSIIQTANKLVALSKKDPNDNRIYTLLLILLSLESILDRGRMFLTGDNLKELPSINQGIDALRRDIYDLMKKLDHQQLKSTLNTAAENLKLNFTK